METAIEPVTVLGLKLQSSGTANGSAKKPAIQVTQSAELNNNASNANGVLSRPNRLSLDVLPIDVQIKIDPNCEQDCDDFEYEELPLNSTTPGAERPPCIVLDNEPNECELGECVLLNLVYTARG